MRHLNGKFQSPRSGKFVSNEDHGENRDRYTVEFQSPRSGKFVSNDMKEQRDRYAGNKVSIP